MSNYAFVETWRMHQRRISMVLGLSLLCAPLSYSVYAEDGVSNTMVQVVTQTKTVKGTVVDESGEPLIGVSIVVEGTSTGTITDFDGNFSINLPAGKKELVISYIGYKEQTVTVTGNGLISVKMVSDTQALDEVVVIGYGTVKKRDLTGSVTSVKSGDITMNPTSNPMEALQGKVAGLDITRESGKAGSGVNMQLRGTRSFDASGTPTFIIDGMPGDYSTLNPNDIESIEILKDASSTAVYGSSGANGVIIITTKNAKEGKAVVHFNAYVGVNGWIKRPEVRSGESFIQMRRDAGAAAGTWNSEADDEKLFDNVDQFNAYKNGQWVDWLDESLHNGYEQNYSLSVSGGTEKTKAYFSLNYSDERGTYTNDNNRIYSLRAKIDQKINRTLTAGINLQLAYTHSNTRKGVYTKAMTSLPLGTAYNEDGSINPEPIPGSTEVSVLTDEQGGVYKNQTKNVKVYVNGYMEWKPFKGFSFRSIAGATLTDKRNGQFKSMDSYEGLSGSLGNTNYSYVTNGRSYNYKWENIATYNFQIAKDHDFTVTGVTSWNHNQNENFDLGGRGIPYDSYLFYNLKSATTGKEVVSKYEMSKGMGLVARLNYSYLGRYLFSASCRWDASSRLAAGNRWDSFPSVAVGWRVSDEAFMESTKKWLSNLKLRLSYGVTGTAAISPYSSASTLDATTTSLALGGLLVPVVHSSEYVTNLILGWEKSYTSDIGIDVSFLNNRIELTADYYHTKTKDIIYARTMPSTMGGYTPNAYFKMNQNVCETLNKGFELSVTSRNFVKKNFTWSTTLTFATNKEEVVSIPGVEDGILVKTGTKDEAFIVGRPVKSYYGYKYAGIWQEDEVELAALYGCKPGYVKVATDRLQKKEDGTYYYMKNGKETVVTDKNPMTYDSNDYQYIGQKSPKWSAGLQNTFTYKDFDFSFFLMARYGQTINYDAIGFFDPSGKENSYAHFDYWTPENPNAYFPAVNSTLSRSTYKGFGALNYVDGSYIKLKNVTLGYSLPKSVLSKVGINKFRVYTTISNSLVWAKEDLLKDYDPEMGGSIDFPLTRQFVFGVNVTF